MTITYQSSKIQGLQPKIVQIVRDFIKNRCKSSSVIKADMLFNPDKYFLFEQLGDRVELSLRSMFG